MTRRAYLFLSGGAISFVVTLFGCLVLIPQVLYPRLNTSDLLAVTDPTTRIELQQAQAQLQNNARSALLQAIAGLLVVAGAVATWRQVQVAREGHITERYTRAVDQVGSDNIDVRIGGIYALERVARNSSEDRPQVQYLLAAFVRGHAPWPQDATDHSDDEATQSLPWLYVRAPDVQAALNVLCRRQPSSGALRLYLSRVDLRSANLDNGKLINAQIRHTNLARSWMVAAALDGSDLTNTDLRHARAVKASFAKAILCRARLEDADLRDANLRGADLRGADMRARNLEYANLVGAVTDAQTVWPEGFNPSNAGVIKESDILANGAPPSASS